MELSGFHHLTAVSSRISDNKAFYTETLGMRLVKRTVNQDDTSAYHLYYADKVGSPGTDITFFDWDVPPERRGNNTVTRTGLRVRSTDSLEYWLTRFNELGVKHEQPVEIDGRMQVLFEDREGQRLSLIVDNGEGDEPVTWEKSPVPAQHQIRGLGSIIMTVPSIAQTDAVLRSNLNMTAVREYEQTDGVAVHVYSMRPGGSPAELHVEVRPDLAPARPGAGGVHHVAFRVPDHEYDAWADRLTRAGVPNSGKVDRYYFRSLYFREPNGVLLELASDGPGFAVDEPLETLGESVVLPPFLEPRRERILQALKQLG